MIKSNKSFCYLFVYLFTCFVLFLLRSRVVDWYENCLIRIMNLRREKRLFWRLTIVKKSKIVILAVPSNNNNKLYFLIIRTPREVASSLANLRIGGKLLFDIIGTIPFINNNKTKHLIRYKKFYEKKRKPIRPIFTFLQLVGVQLMERSDG